MYLIIKRSLNLFISHFPLLVILGNFVKRVLNHVSKNRLLQIYERALKDVKTEYVMNAEVYSVDSHKP